MCGIIAYVGQKQATPILIDSLKRLEYRGYDSAGIAVLSDEKLVCHKKKGRIQELEDKIALDYPNGTMGLAHTRWATHGIPSDLNAHPHHGCNKKLVIIHNGIIENYLELKEQLKKKGHRFKSETDTEVLAHLIEQYLEKGLTLLESVRQALKQVEGTYGVAVMTESQKGEIVAAKNGSPLVIGVGKNEHFIASDVSALLPYTRQVVYPRDGEIVKITKDDFIVRSIEDRAEKKRRLENIEWDQEMVKKKGYKHFMLKEIFEQPQIIRNAIAGRIIPEEGMTHLGGLNYTDQELQQVKRILFLACGTAYYAGMIGKYLIEELVGIPVDVEFASEFRYKNMILNDKTLIFVISQSGETADTIAVMREIQRKGHKVLGVSNIVGSTVARETNGGMYIHAGPEIGVASTKAFMAQITVLTLLAVKIGRHKNMTLRSGKEIVEALIKIPAQIESVLELETKIKDLAKKYKNAKDFLYLGRKMSYPISLEGALKLKEVSYIHAEAYAAGEMKHGPIALIDRSFPTFAIAPRDSVYEKMISNIQEIKARKGKIIALGSKGDRKLKTMVDDFIGIPETIEWLSPMLSVVPLQLFAYHVAVLNKRDVDKPRNLAKSVTVE